MLLALILETIQTIVLTQDVFRGFARGFNDFSILNEVGNVWFSIGLMTGSSMFKSIETDYIFS